MESNTETEFSEHFVALITGSESELRRSEKLFHKNWWKQFSGSLITAKFGHSSIHIHHESKPANSEGSEHLFWKIASNDRKIGLLKTLETVYTAEMKGNKKLEWVLLLEPQSFVNLKSLPNMMKSLSKSVKKDSHYIGLPLEDNYGRYEYKYCAEGGVLISKWLMKKIYAKRNSFDSCLSLASSDTSMYKSLGRCIHKFTGKSCTSPDDSFIFHLEDYFESDSFRTPLNEHHKRSLLSIASKKAFPERSFSSVIIYPLNDQLSVGRYVLHTSTALKPIINPSHLHKSMRFGKVGGGQLWDEYCVNNPMNQVKTFPATYLRECPSARPLANSDPMTPISEIPAFVLSLDSDIDYFEEIKSCLENHNINPQRFMGVDGYASSDVEKMDDPVKSMRQFSLGEIFPRDRFSDERAVPRHSRTKKMSPGEHGYRLTMKKLFQYAIKQNLQYILVFDDDAVPDCNFADKLQKLLQDDRCAMPLKSTDTEMGGILLLGFAIWHKGSYPSITQQSSGWAILDADYKNHSEPVGSQCVNVHDQMFGSFAVIYHRDVFNLAIEWIESNNNPFDWLFSHFSDYGIPVRAAFPNLVIQDVGHRSRVNPNRKHTQDLKYRAKRHRWNLNNFCDSLGHTLSSFET